ncbi:MAG: hypothetical protein RLZZ416_707 [Candidatus Parcubacteria bacterium]|jgi:hypothetical protein
MPDYEGEPNEWESNRTVTFKRHIEVQIKAFKQRIQMARTVGALQAIRHDIEQGSLANNQQAKDVLKRFVNQHARELGWKEGQWWA